MPSPTFLPDPRAAVSRRMFLADFGMGFTGLALGAMMLRDGVARASTEEAWAPPKGRPHFAPKAKSVIWLFMRGGVSHLESFDPKPEIDKFAGKTIASMLIIAPPSGFNEAPQIQRGKRF